MPKKYVSQMAGGRKKKTGGRKRRVQQGGNIFHDILGGIKKGANFVKDNKLISRGAALAGLIPGNPYAAHGRVIGGIASQLGLGRQQMGGRSVIRI